MTHRGPVDVERVNAQAATQEFASLPPSAQANAHQDDSYPRPLGVPGNAPQVGERYQVTEAGRDVMAAAPRIPDSFPELLKFAAGDSLSGHINNAAQIIALTRGLGSQLTAADLVAIRRRLLAALMVLEGVA